MAELVTIEARNRTDKGKNAARRLRRTGWIPANLIGKEKGSLLLELEAKNLSKAWQQGKKFKLSCDGDVKEVRIQELQLNAAKRQAIHVDLMYV